MADVSICWFKRDLRVTDHPALARAAELGTVIPLYIVEPELWRQPDMSGRQYDFLTETLAGLRQDLAQLGLSLVLRVGDAVDVLEELRGRTGAGRLVSHEETGNSWTFARDRAVASWARGQGVTWEELPQCGVVRRLPGRDGWQRSRDRFMAADMCAPPRNARPGPVVESDPVPRARDLGLSDQCPFRQKGGRDRAERAIEGFLRTRGRTYRRAMSSPLTGARACSRVSPHLAFGTISVRETVQMAKVRQTEVKGRRDGWAGSLRSFQSRLAWRDHFMQKLEDEPAIEHRCLHPDYEGLRPAQPDRARLEAWANGETGLPFVDACMRSLRATGWLNFRMRSMVMAVASYHLWIDWRETGPVLARLFTDYEPGIHWSQVQMQSGTTGINSIRIYNPVKQGLDQDPDGLFTRRWIPELSAVPDEFLQMPWRWQEAGRVLGHVYPHPVVAPEDAARAARQAVWAVRGRPGFRDRALGIAAQHGSRKRSRPGIPAPDRQMRFDF
ncbi:MAG: FAD-binding domain-containing protein [Roseovarius sp.]|nr:FAD-binding domain-containing protein [Roseovarius sp.]